MAKIIVDVKRIDTQSGFDVPTTANVEFVVNDHPANVDRHLYLLGLLAKSKIVLSDDEGKFTITIKE